MTDHDAERKLDLSPPGSGAPDARAAEAASGAEHLPAGGSFEGASSEPVTILGVPYVLHRLADGGELYLTALGERLRDFLDPARWFAERAYQHVGKRLGFSTGAVYRVPLPGSPGRRSMVVKFSRFAQDARAMLGAYAPPSELTDAPRFLSPFEELALLEALRTSPLAPRHRRVRTKQAFGIYCPPRQFRHWQLGRADHELAIVRRHLAGEAAANVEVHEDRIYVVLFEWIRGENVQELAERDALDAGQALAMSEQAVADMEAAGFGVVDHKPNHVILRLRPDGSIPMRGGRPVYAMADFELLVPTADYLAYLLTPAGAGLRATLGWLLPPDATADASDG